MGIQRDNGYSATVEAFLVVGESMIRLAKTGLGSEGSPPTVDTAHCRYCAVRPVTQHRHIH